MNAGQYKAELAMSRLVG